MKMRDHFKSVLVNPTWEQMVERDPLIAFSHFLSGRVQVLFAISDEVIENLDGGFSKQAIDYGRIIRAESLMWLWILGAYEVVRTMCQANACFNQQVLDELIQLKKLLSVVRMPAAKMEKSGVKTPVTSNRSPAGLDLLRRDLIVGDPESTDIFARDLLAKFNRVFSSIKATDILGRHEDAYTSNV